MRSVPRSKLDRASLMILTLVTFGLIAIGPIIEYQPGGSPAAQDEALRFIILDNACDGRTLRLNRVDPAATSGQRGDTSVVSGKLFVGQAIPAGFDRRFDLDANTPNSIGTWVCANTIISEPPLTHAITYYFTLEDGMLVVQGLNSHRTQGGVSRVHAIVGGTGRFSGAAGEVQEDIIGNNSTGAFNLRYVFRIKKKSLR